MEKNIEQQDIHSAFDEKLEQRLNELIQMAIEVERTKKASLGDYTVDTILSQKWFCGCLSLISRLVGEKDTYYRSFRNLERDIGRLSCLKFGLGVLYALREDFRKGLLIQRDLYVAAEIYDDVLVGVYFLLGNKQKGVAVLLMMAVLHSALRRLCLKNGIYFNNKDEILALNERLYQSETFNYNSLIYKKIIYFADLHQKTLQGEFDRLDQKECEDMYKWLRFFLEKFLT